MDNDRHNAPERIVVIGGGFAGLNFLKHIDRRQYQIDVVDRNNFHAFPPLFYQVASASLEPSSIAFPFRREMHKMKRKPVYHMGDVSVIDTVGKVVVTQYEKIPYDRLVIAAGTTNNFFGNADLVKRVYTIKRTAEALRCRNEILDRLERASIARDSAERRRLLSFVVVGGGPAGVEMAGAIGEMKRDLLVREYPGIKQEEMTVTIIEGSPRLLQAMSEKSSRYALKALGRLMVDVRLHSILQTYDNDTVTLADGETLPAGMVIWTAGVTSVNFKVEGRELPLGPGSRIIVDEYNRVEGFDDIYALGDISYHSDKRYPRGCPQLAQVAIQQARNLARNLNCGQMSRRFEYRDRGSMATIGRNKAVAELRHVSLTGWIAWLVWMFIHLISILGMRNKAVVLTNWVWAYFTYPTSLRVLIHTARYPLRSRWAEQE